MVAHFNTFDVPPAEQADHWRCLVSAAFGPMRLRSRHGDGFAARLKTRMFGPVITSEVNAPEHTVSRTERQIAQDSRECYKVGLVLRGSCVLQQGGRRAVVEPGAVLLYDLTRPFDISFDDHRVFAVVVPHQAIPLPPDQVAHLTGSVLADRTSAHGTRTGRLMTSLLAELVDDPDTAEGPYAHHLGEAIVEFITGSMRERLHGAPPPAATNAELLLAIADWIEHRLDDPALSPAAIAEAHHLSVRQLYRVFQDKGTTVVRYVRHRRLERCRGELRDPFMATQAISAIATRWGFLDAAAFSRAFRTAYGKSPRAYRAAATGIARPD